MQSSSSILPAKEVHDTGWVCTGRLKGNNLRMDMTRQEEDTTDHVCAKKVSAIIKPKFLCTEDPHAWSHVRQAMDKAEMFYTTWRPYRRWDPMPASSTVAQT